MNLIFKEINKENWEECIELEVAEEQKNFVAPNSYSLLQATYYEDLYPLGIYDGDLMVGFLMYGFEPELNGMEMCRLMIDKKYQSKGYGTKAVSMLMDLIREKNGNIELYTSIEPENSVAQKVYESLGFRKTGKIMWEEEVMVVQL